MAIIPNDRHLIPLGGDVTIDAIIARVQLAIKKPGNVTFKKKKM
jgi:hypothetical protein